MKTTTITAICLLLTMNLFAQSHFVRSGIVEYEKSVNMYTLIGKNIGNNSNDIFGPKAFEQYKKNQPQFKILKSTLTFSNNKTLFVPIVDDGVAMGGMFNIPQAQQNSIVYTDVTTRSTISQRKMFDENFLVKDSVVKIKWKITDETREIAGYTCRRANALILDSVYVVAFFTDQITVDGGPEIFTGLPGMILQIALPHENMSWIATKVTDTTVPATAVIPPKKGKVVTDKELRETIMSVYSKKWNGWERLIYKMLML